ncbi:hypothetical protein U9M48_007861 [Paspalum notatum var. saurae]|uniref:HMA domain-containing protein n=1 Tax=Paspalum notatum var. saurae TaxID=547442 RepID=A0AAQ3SMZ0_PASNO
MADVVSDLVLSFFCCCFYAPGDNRGVGTHQHHYGGGHAHPTCGGAEYDYGHRGAAGGRKVSGRGRPVSLQTVELKVRMCCEGCERTVRQALQNLRGVDSVEVNVAMEKVRVTGYVDRARVLQEVRRSGKKAEFWPGGGGAPLRFFTPSPRTSYFRDSYNYRRRGYGDGDRHGRMMREPARGAYPVGNMFNDDDVDAACRIM